MRLRFTFVAMVACAIGCGFSVIAADQEWQDQGEDSPTGLPDEYAKNYLVARSTVSPDKKFAVIYPTLEAEKAADRANDAERIKDYVVALQPFTMIKPLDTKVPYFQHASKMDLSAEWSDGSAVGLITLDGWWGPQDVFVVEVRDGKLSRITNIARKVRDLLLPNYRKAKAEQFNDFFDFVFVADPAVTSFKLEGTSRVVIDASAETSPNIPNEDLRPSDRAWRGHVQAVWDIAQARFVSQKVSGGIRKRTKGASD